MAKYTSDTNLIRGAAAVGASMLPQDMSGLDPIIKQGMDMAKNALQQRKDILNKFRQLAIVLSGEADFPGDGDPEDHDLGYWSNRFGVFIKGVSDGTGLVYFNWGWFEDKILNKYFGYADTLEDLITLDDDTIEKTEGSLFAKFNSRNSYASYNKSYHLQAMKNEMHTATSANKTPVLYPMNWDKTYNTYRNKCKQ